MENVPQGTAYVLAEGLVLFRCYNDTDTNLLISHDSPSIG